MKQWLVKGLITIAIVCSGVGAFANGPAPHGFWPGYFGSAAINNRWGLWAEAQYRAYDFKGDLEQLLLRTAVTYNLGKDKAEQLALGYAYVRSEPYISGTEEKRVTEEHRVYQQLILKKRYSRLYVSHRYRVEERFLSNDFKVRFRYFLGGSLCLNKKELTEGTIYLTGYNELFLQNSKPVFDRNRVFGGVGYSISKNLRIEGGNMWQLQETSSRPQVQLMVWHNLSL